MVAARILSSKQRIITIVSPKNDDILDVGVAATFSIYAPSETAVKVYKDNTLLGSATSVGGGYWTYSYTPPAVDYTGFTIRAYGVYSNYSVGTFLFVAEANAINTTITAWSKTLGTGGTITGGITDPDGGTNAYSVNAAAGDGSTTYSIASPTMSPAMTEFNHGLDIWVAQKPSTSITTIYFQTNGGIYFNIATEESFSANGGGGYVKVVERRTVASILWKRLRLRREAKTAVSTSWRLNLNNAVAVGNTTCAAGDGIYVYKPRSLDGIIPFTQFEKCNFYYVSTTGGVELWRIQHPWCFDVSIMNSSYRTVQVVKPSGWSPTGNHRGVIMLPARIDVLEPVTPQQAVIDGDLANTYNAVFMANMDDTQTFGCKVDGTINSHAVAGELLPQLAIKFFGCKPGRNFRTVGYSKTAVTAYSLLMNYPNTFAKAGGWDGVWDCYRQWDEVSPPPGQVQGSLIFSLACDTKANFANYDALSLLDSKISTINDKKRLVLAGYSQWSYYLAPFKAELDARGIQYDYENTIRASHTWGSGWFPSMMANLMTDPV